jgi:hypothetical protein
MDSIPNRSQGDQIKHSRGMGWGVSDMWAQTHRRRRQEEVVCGDLDCPQGGDGGGPGFYRNKHVLSTPGEDKRRMGAEEQSSGGRDVAHIRFWHRVKKRPWNIWRPPNRSDGELVLYRCFYPWLRMVQGNIKIKRCLEELLDDVFYNSP